MTQKQISILHPKHGSILCESFVDDIQFKLFLKSVNGCLSLKRDLTFYDGNHFLIHIPYVVLKSSIVTTKVETITPGKVLIESALEKSH